MATPPVGTRKRFSLTAMCDLKAEADSKRQLVRQPVLRLMTTHSSPTRASAAAFSAMAGASLSAPMGLTRLDWTADPRKIHRFIVGRDQGVPKEMTPTEVNRFLQDPFANLLLKRNIFPITADDVVMELNKTAQLPQGQTQRRTFVVAEGGQVPWERATEKMVRSFRLVFSISTKDGIGPDILISTGKETGSDRDFLQLMGWDSKNRAYNFYQRLRFFWIYSGSSSHALDPRTRAKGPFSGHINGGPIMKELQAPWSHWHSMNVEIRPTALGPHDPFRHSVYFRERKDARIFEEDVRAGISAWNKSRIDRALQSPQVTNFPYFLRQILKSSNVNLASSRVESKLIQEGSSDLTLPFGLFVNFEGLSKAGIDPAVQLIKVASALYTQNLQRFSFRLESNGQRVEGDTHFAFLIPAVAIEDNDLLEKMIRAEMISPRLAACLLMVDFSNPIYSKRKEALIPYIPQVITAGNKGNDLDQKFLANVVGSRKHLITETPEHEFHQYWQIPESETVAQLESMIVTFFAKVQAHVQSQAGYDQIAALAESRRHTFKQTAQFEFPLTFVVNDIPTAGFPLRLTKQGTVEKV